MIILRKKEGTDQYVLVDGSRGFTSTVSGVDPIYDYHLATKRYVDQAVSSISGAASYFLGENKFGREPIVSGSISTTVVFDSAFTDSSYTLVLDLENQLDAISSEYALTVIDKTTSGFTVNYSGDIDSSNYYLNWFATLSGVSTDSLATQSDLETCKQEILGLMGQNKSGTTQLSLGDSSTNITFDSEFTSPNYALLLNLQNDIDFPSSEYALTITNKTTSGFSVNYSGDIDSDNYKLNWLATLSGSFGGGDYLASIVEDTSPQLGGNLDLDDYSVVLNTTPSGNFIHGYTVGWSGEISSMRLDDNNGFSSPLYVKSNGHMALCTAASGTTQMPCIAVSLEEGTGIKKVLWGGIVRKGSWNWTPGDVIYVSTVEGALTKTKPSQGGVWQQSVGVAIAADTIKFTPGYNPGNIEGN